MFNASVASTWVDGLREVSWRLLFFFSLAFSVANVFSAFLAALAALHSFFNLLRTLRSSFDSALSFDFRFLSFLVSPVTLSCSPYSYTGVEQRHEDSGEGGATPDAVFGSSSGPNTGPLKNREYRPRLAASLLAVARSDRAALVPVLGVADPDVEAEAGVPEIGRRLEMMPVSVRRRAT